MTTPEGELINKTAEATSKALAETLKHLRLQPAPTVRMIRFVDHAQKVGDLTIKGFPEVAAPFGLHAVVVAQKKGESISPMPSTPETDNAFSCLKVNYEHI